MHQPSHSRHSWNTGQRWRKVEFIARTYLPDVPWPWPSAFGHSPGTWEKRRWLWCPGCLSAQLVAGMLRGVCLKNGGGERIIWKGTSPPSASIASKETVGCWAPRRRHLWSWKKRGPSAWIFFIQTLKEEESQQYIRPEERSIVSVCVCSSAYCPSHNNDPKCHFCYLSRRTY